MQPLSMLICAEVLDALKKIGDDSVDCVITSPPYNIGYKQGAMGTDLKGHIYGDENYDFIDENEYQSWMVQVLDELHRIVKPTGSLFFNHKDRTKITVKNKEGKLVKKTHVFVSPTDFINQTNWNVKQRLIWNRKTSHQQNVHMFTPIHEDIYWLVKNPKTVIKNKITLPTILDFKRELRKKHPAPFPLELPTALIQAVAPPNAVILDPFVGSGTTVLAADKLGHYSIGIDNVKRYIQMCEHRIKEQGGKVVVFGV